MYVTLFVYVCVYECVVFLHVHMCVCVDLYVVCNMCIVLFVYVALLSIVYGCALCVSKRVYVLRVGSVCQTCMPYIVVCVKHM